MTTDTRHERRLEPICPSWCAGHNDAGYQGWEERIADGKFQRDHASETQTTKCAGDWPNMISVDVDRIEELDTRTLGPVMIGIYLDTDAVTLTPQEAREHAAQLIAAADQAEAEVRS